MGLTFKHKSDMKFFQIILFTLLAFTIQAQDCQTKLLQLTTENQGLRLDVLRLTASLKSTQARYTESITGYNRIINQGDSILFRIDEINGKLNKQTTPNSNFGFGIGYYTAEVWEIQALIYMGDPYFVLGVIPNNGYGKIGIGTQFNSKFSGGIFITKDLGAASQVSFGSSIMFNAYKGLKVEVGADSKFGARFGLNYII